MENFSYTQSTYAAKNTFVNMFLHPDLIGDHNFTGWRLYVTKEREVSALPYDEVTKAHLKKMLKKAKYGIGVDDLGGFSPVNKIEQVAEARILPPWPVCSLRYLQML